MNHTLTRVYSPSYPYHFYFQNSMSVLQTIGVTFSGALNASGTSGSGGVILQYIRGAAFYSTNFMNNFGSGDKTGGALTIDTTRAFIGRYVRND